MGRSYTTLCQPSTPFLSLSAHRAKLDYLESVIKQKRAENTPEGDAMAVVIEQWADYIEIKLVLKVSALSSEH